MPKGQRQPVSITSEHMAMYIELRKQGYTIPQGILFIQKKYNMPRPHTRQAVDRRFKLLKQAGKSVEIPKRDGTARVAKVVPPASKSKQSRNGDQEFLQYLRTMPLDEVDDKTLRILKWAIEYPNLKEVNNRLQNMVYSRDQRIKELEEQVREEKQREMKVRLAQGRQVIHGD